MPALRTDDGPRKLRAVWLGPKGAMLPFEWTYVQWAVTLLAMPFTAIVAVGLAHLLGGPGWLQIVAFIYGSAAGIYLAIKIMRNVTFDEPLKHKRATVRAEFSRHRRPSARPTAWAWTAPVITELTPQASGLLTPERNP